MNTEVSQKRAPGPGGGKGGRVEHYIILYVRRVSCVEQCPVDSLHAVYITSHRRRFHNAI